MLNNVRVRVNGGLTEERCRAAGLQSVFDSAVLRGVRPQRAATGTARRAFRTAERPDSRERHFRREHRRAGARPLSGAWRRSTHRRRTSGHRRQAGSGYGSRGDRCRRRPRPYIRKSLSKWLSRFAMAAAAGFANVALDAGGEALRRRVWLSAGESASVRFLNLKRRDAGPVSLRCGADRENGRSLQARSPRGRGALSRVSQYNDGDVAIRQHVLFPGGRRFPAAAVRRSIRNHLSPPRSGRGRRRGGEARKSRPAQQLGRTRRHCGTQRSDEARGCDGHTSSSPPRRPPASRWSGTPTATVAWTATRRSTATPFGRCGSNWNGMDRISSGITAATAELGRSLRTRTFQRVTD